MTAYRDPLDGPQRPNLWGRRIAVALLIGGLFLVSLPREPAPDVPRDVGDGRLCFWQGLGYLPCPDGIPFNGTMTRVGDGLYVYYGPGPQADPDKVYRR